jgi:hypothetical protein
VAPPAPAESCAKAWVANANPAKFISFLQDFNILKLSCPTPSTQSRVHCLVYKSQNLTIFPAKSQSITEKIYHGEKPPGKAVIMRIKTRFFSRAAKNFHKKIKLN